MGSSDQIYRRARPWLGTIVEISVPSNHEAAVEIGFAAIARIHRLMSFHDEASDLSKTRVAEAGQVIELAPETVSVLQTAADLHVASAGLFNVAVGRQLIKSGFLPRMDATRLNNFGGTASDIEILDAIHIRLRRKTLIDLGGIAKGYAVDCAVAALEAVGVPRGVVNAGGDLRAFGDHPVPVVVRMANGVHSEAILIQNTAMASSENSSARRRHRGQISTPHIGPGGQSMLTCQTVTVIADSCIVADAMTKVAMADSDLADRLLAANQGQVVRFALSEVN